MRVAVYTCLVGGYDRLLPPLHRAKDVDYICFTDDTGTKVEGWDVLPLAHPVSVHGYHFINRYHKIFPYEVLPKHDWSVYIDANIRFTASPMDFVERARRKGAEFACPRHPQRSRVQDEAAACRELGRFDRLDAERISAQLEAYRRDGMPDEFLASNCLLVRDHASEGLSAAMEMWWQHVTTFTRRDQISLPYVLWKTGLPFVLLEENHCVPNPYFYRYPHRVPGIKGAWQSLMIRRDEVPMYRLLYRLRQLLRKAGV